jgi:hypothetical protein
MRRGLAMSWHGLSFLIAAGLYFVFVLPRWWELTGDVSHGLGTAMRIVTGAVLGLTALPVVFTLIRTRRPEFGTPQLALTLRLWSIVAHVLAGVLIVGATIAEIWLDLDTYGQWLFGVYGGAAAIAVLAAVAFYLAFAAELPPPPPKPLKPKKAKASRTQASSDDDTPEGDVIEAADDVVAEEAGEDEKADVTAEAEPAETEPAEPEPVTEEAATEEKTPALRNRRPSGKTRAST